LVVGISKPPRRVTKRALKKLDGKSKHYEKQITDKNREKKAQKRLGKLKRLGVFVKSYNMGHLLATRYKVEEDFGIQSSLNDLDKKEAEIKNHKAALTKIENENPTNKAEVEKVSKILAAATDEYKNVLNQLKVNTGTEMYNRFMKGFVKTNNQDDNERISNTEFLFKKLKF